MNDKNSIPYSIGYFGKLPSFNDFVRNNSGNDELLSLDKWIQDGLADLKLKYKTDWKNIYAKAIPYNFLISNPGSEYLLTGKMFSCYDKNGRSYPFIIFIRSEKPKDNKVSTIFQTFQFSDAYTTFENIFSSLGDCGNNQEINSIVEESFGNFNFDDANSVYRHFIQDTTSYSFWETLLGKFNHPDKYFFIKKIKNGRLNNQAFLDGIKFNFTSAAGIKTEHILFIVDIISRVTATGTLNVFWGSSDSEIILFVFCSSLVSQNYLDIMNPEHPDLRLLRLNGGLNTGSEFITYPPSVKILAEKEELNLIDFIQSI